MRELAKAWEAQLESVRLSSRAYLEEWERAYLDTREETLEQCLKQLGDEITKLDTLLSTLRGEKDRQEKLSDHFESILATGEYRAYKSIIPRLEAILNGEEVSND